MKKKSEEQATKKCSKCEEVKLLDEFHRSKGEPDGYNFWCKVCKKQYNQNNKKNISAQKAQHYQDNKERIGECHKRYYQNNKEGLLEYSRQYYQNNKEKVYEYGVENRDRINKRQRMRKQNDVSYRLRCNVSTCIWQALTRNTSGKDGQSVMKYLPYTIPELKEHLEKQFEPWMTWENYGEWHLDHVYPQSKLPYDSMEHPNFQKCWALENLQPLEAKENIRKGDKVI